MITKVKPKSQTNFFQLPATDTKTGAIQTDLKTPLIYAFNSAAQRLQVRGIDRDDTWEVDLSHYQKVLHVTSFHGFLIVVGNVVKHDLVTLIDARLGEASDCCQTFKVKEYRGVVVKEDVVVIVAQRLYVLRKKLSIGVPDIVSTLLCPVGYDSVVQYLNVNMCAENVVSWRALHFFEKSFRFLDVDVRYDMGKKIWAKYFLEGSKHEVWLVVLC